MSETPTVPPGDLSQTKRDLLNRLLQGQARPSASTGAIPRRPQGGRIPLSYEQEQIWTHAQMAPEVPLYNEPVTLHHRGPLDAKALERAFNEILRRHEAWRTSFQVRDGQPMQVVHRHFTVSLPVHDLRRLPESEREPEAVRVASQDAKAPFDPTRLPLFRARLVRLTDEDQRLYLTLSHMIFDGVVLYQMLVPELAQLYAAYSAGKSSPLAEPPLQYPDYACWQRENRQPEEVARDLAYWRAQLQGLPSRYLPSAGARSVPPTFGGAMYPFNLPIALTSALRTFSRMERVSLFHILLAGFAALLHRYSGEPVLPIGSVSAGRGLAETQRLFGCLANQVVVRADMSGDPTFGELVGRMRDAAIAMLEHDKAPFELLVRELQVAREAGRTPIFQAMILLEPSLPELEAAWQMTHREVETGAAKYDLCLELDERAEEIWARFLYRTDLFDRQSVARMAGHFRTVLEAGLADPGRRLSELPILTPDERQRLLTAWNVTREPCPGAGVHELFQEQAERSPQRVAVVFGDQLLTYRELNERANQLAWHLRKRGVGTDVLVGLCMERSLEMVIGLLGILKAGGAYVPLDPSLPPDRLAFMLGDAKPKLVLTQERLKDTVPEAEDVVLLDANWLAIAAESRQNPCSVTKPNDLAYVMYTSGSTGQPKGAEITHRGIVRLLFGQQYAPLDEEQVFLQLAPISFDASTFELWGALLHGGRCVLFPGNVPAMHELRDVIRRHKVTTLWLTASLFNAMIDQEPEALSGVQQILTGGEALSVPHVRRARHLLRDVALTNGYGPTESTTFACTYRVPQEIAEGATSIPIGRPIANTEIYLLDAHLQLVPVGVTGELYIGGDGLARGYRNRPELTKERFILNPFGSGPGERLYKTGDLARYQPDGNVEFVGRTDDQVKIRGHRIEPGEIESVLGSHEKLRQCVVVARERPAGDKVLVAFFESNGAGTPSADELRAYLKRKLPDYMLPSAFVHLEELPLSPNQKIDRKALPASLVSEASQKGVSKATGRGDGAPRNAVEKNLARIWEGLLGRQGIGVREDFFDLGGHSLLAVQLLAAVEREFGRKLPLSTLLAAPTVEQFAVVLASPENSMVSSVVPIQPHGDRPALFCVHGGGGHVLRFRELALELGPAQPFYGMRSPGFDGSEEDEVTVELLAEMYIRDMRGVQRQGPYYLAGASFGGLVAYEMACQLLEQGEQIALLALFDTPNTAFAKLLPPAPAMCGWLRLLRGKLDLQRRLRDAAGAHGRSAVRQILRALRNRLAFCLWHAGYALCHGLRLPLPALLRDNLKLFTLVGQRYAPRPCAVHVSLFRALDQEMPAELGFDLGWSQVALRGVEVLEIPGDHMTILIRPNVAVVAEQLRTLLSRDAMPTRDEGEFDVQLVDRIDLPTARPVLRTP